MNQELEALILAYEAMSASRDTEAEQALQNFEAQLDEVMNRHPGVARDILRRDSILTSISARRNFVDAGLESVQTILIENGF